MKGNGSFLQEGVPIGGQLEVVLLLSRLLGDQRARQRVALERRERVRKPGAQFRIFSVSDAFWEEPECGWCVIQLGFTGLAQYFTCARANDK